MSNVSQWDTTAGNNNAAPPDGSPEGMDAGKVNDSIREIMAAVARWFAESNGSLVTGGTGDAYTLTTTNSHAALADLQIMVFRTDRANSGAATLKVDSLAAKPWRHPDGTELAEGALKADALQIVARNSVDDEFHWLGPIPQDVRRLGGQFSAHASEPAAMTVGVDAGFVLTTAGTLVTQAAQTTSTITAPTTNPRNDIVVIVGSTGAVAVRAGTEAASPTDPSLSDGDIPLARISLTTSTTTITDAILTDLRPVFSEPGSTGPRRKVAEYTPSSGVIDVTGISDDADNYEIVLSGLEVNVNGVIQLRVSIDDGATFESGASDYEFSGVVIASNPTSHQIEEGGTSQTHIGLASSNASFTFSSNALSNRGVISIADARAADRKKAIRYGFSYGISGSSVADMRGVGVYKGGNEAIDQVRFLNSAGNITAGKAILYRLADE